MKKYLLLIGFLVGCTPVLTAAKVDGMETYTRVNAKIQAVENRVKRSQIAQVPEWLFLESRVKLAAFELRNSLAGNDKKTVSATNNAEMALDFINDLRLNGIYNIFGTKRGLPQFDKVAREKGFESDASWIEARRILAEVLVNLSNIVKNGSNEQLLKATKDFYNAQDIILKLFWKFQPEAK